MFHRLAVVVTLLALATLVHAKKKPVKVPPTEEQIVHDGPFWFAIQKMTVKDKGGKAAITLLVYNASETRRVQGPRLDMASLMDDLNNTYKTTSASGVLKTINPEKSGIQIVGVEAPIEKAKYLIATFLVEAKGTLIFKIDREFWEKDGRTVEATIAAIKKAMAKAKAK